jgi:hypothetical protein
MTVNAAGLASSGSVLAIEIFLILGTTFVAKALKLVKSNEVL